MDNKNRAIGSLVGLAVGDALGSPLEFMERDTYEHITDMIGGGAFDLEPGQWTDDTSMALCLGTSLLASNGFDSEDQLTRYSNWMTNGYMSSTGVCFDIGNTTHIAIREFLKNKTLVHNTDFNSAGNGSLMRLAPIPIFYNTKEMYSDAFVDLIRYAAMSSATTHANEVPMQSCVAFSTMINRAINGYDKLDVIDIRNPEKFGITNELVQNAIDIESYLWKTRTEIKSTGYVIDSLEAALWCFSKTSSFKEAVLLAANLGDDADTVAAITGMLAGAFYSIHDIPEEWVHKLTNSEGIVSLAERLYDWNN